MAAFLGVFLLATILVAMLYPAALGLDKLRWRREADDLHDPHFFVRIGRD